MNELQIFQNAEFGEVRVTTINDEPWLMLNDVCRILEIGNSRQAKTRLSEKGVISNDILTEGGKQQATFINEANLYKLVFQSRKPQAEKFTEWVTSEVLPSIRKRGVYATDELLDNPDFLIKALEELKKEREEKAKLQEKVHEDAPKVLFADSVESAQNSCLVGELAKILKQNGIDIGQNKLFKWLRKNGYLIRQKGENYNLPTQKSMDLKLMEIKKRTISNADGTIRTTRTTKITGKGQIYFVNKFLNEKVI